jgi:hypothetical protein
VVEDACRRAVGKYNLIAEADVLRILDEHCPIKPAAKKYRLR